MFDLALAFLEAVVVGERWSGLQGQQGDQKWQVVWPHVFEVRMFLRCGCFWMILPRGRCYLLIARTLLLITASWCSARLLQGLPAAVQLCALRWCVLLPPTFSTSCGGLRRRFGVTAKAQVRCHISSSVTGNGSFGPSILRVC